MTSTTRTTRRPPAAAVRGLAGLLAGSLLAACAGLPTARMALPQPLAAQAPVVLAGVGPGRSGDFTLGAESGRFERGADRLTLFDVVSADRVAVRYRTGTTSASCRGRQVEASVGVLTGSARPFGFTCRFEGGFAGQLALDGQSGAAGTQAQRRGRLTAGGVTIDIESVHRLQGTPLPLATPAGYLLTAAGQPVAAVELTDTQARVWLPAGPPALTAAATHAALALALLWDPSNRID